MFFKRTFSSLCVFLSLLMVLLCIVPALVSCDNGNSSATDPADTSAEETPDSSADTEPAADPDVLDLVVKGVSQVKVIRHQDLDSDNAQVKAAITIRKQLVTSTGADVSIEDDWVQKGADHDHDTLEILVGNTNYSETAEAQKDLKYGDFLMTVVGNKIVVLGYTDEAMSAAASAFCKAVIANTTQDEGASTFSLSVKKSLLHAGGTKNKTISELPEFDGAASVAYYEGGLDTDELIFDGATADSYNAYVQKLIDAGYKKYTDNTIKTNLFTTLYNDKHTINVGYYDYYKTVHTVVEPFTPQSLIGLESDNVTETVTTGQITMIGLEYQKTDGSYAANGMSILIRLTDGRFIIIDGGHSGIQADADMLVNQMKEQSADYISKTGGIKVAAWIITHSHGDHNGMINSKSSTFNNAGIKIERVIVNFLSANELAKAKTTYSGNFTESEGNGWSATVSAADKMNAPVVNARVGQVFYFANAKLEVLYTIDSYAPKVCNAQNTTSLIIKMTFTDPVTKKETVYMSTGDATGPAFMICYNMYGDYLKSDIVQVAHHGATTWGTENGTTSAYKAMAPETLLWPVGKSAYSKYRTKSYNSVLWNESNPNYKETYVAGVEGNYTVIPLPYVVGTGTQTNPS